MPRLALTDRFIAGAKASEHRRPTFSTAKTTRLALRVTNAGHGLGPSSSPPDTGKRARISLGSYPALTLSAARTRASEARGLL